MRSTTRPCTPSPHLNLVHSARCNHHGTLVARVHATHHTSRRRIWLQAALQPLPQLDASLDERLSQRPLQLDPCGYFLVLLDRDAQEIVVEWYTNTINKHGNARCFHA